MRWFVWYCLLTIGAADSAKILAMYSVAMISHQRSLLSVSKTLSLKGHQVTSITTNPLNDRTLTNHTEIDISSLYDFVRKEPLTKILSIDGPFIKNIIRLRNAFLENAKHVFEIDAVQKLINSNETFDLVMVEAHDPIYFAFSWKFKAPLVGM